MKKKLIIKETGKSVEVGDIIEIHYHQIKKNGTEIIGIVKTALTEETIPKLIKKGVLAVQTFGQPTGYEEIPTNLQYYCDKFVNSITTEPILSVHIKNSINHIIHKHPYIVFQLLLRQIAIELDHRYEGDISKSDKIFVVGSTDGKVRELNKNIIKNFRNFAAFRTAEDAEFAKKILGSLIERMYGRKQKD